MFKDNWYYDVVLEAYAAWEYMRESSEIYIVSQKQHMVQIRKKNRRGQKQKKRSW